MLRLVDRDGYTDTWTDRRMLRLVDRDGYTDRWTDRRMLRLVDRDGYTDRWTVGYTDKCAVRQIISQLSFILSKEGR
jgi:hypothetical protein